MGFAFLKITAFSCTLFLIFRPFSSDFMFRVVKPAPSRPRLPWLQECEPNKSLMDIQPREETSQRSDEQIKEVIKSTQARTFTPKAPVPPIPRPESQQAQASLFRLPRGASRYHPPICHHGPQNQGQNGKRALAIPLQHTFQHVGPFMGRLS